LQRGPQSRTIRLMRTSLKALGRERFLAAALLITLTVSALYLNAVWGKFIWDDNLLIVENPLIKNWSGLSRIFSGDIGEGAGAPYRYYRPLQLFTYLIEHSLWGLQPAGYHITNIALHILVSMCVCGLALLLFRNRLIALLAALIFAAHPVQSESVSYISSRGDLLSAFFLLGCFIFYVLFFRTKKKIFPALSLVTYLLALLSKENALILVPLILLYHASFKEKLRPFLLGFFVCLTAGYLALRYSAIEPSRFYPELALQRVPGFFAAFVTYIRLLVFPVAQRFTYGNPLFTFADPLVWVGVFLYIFLVWQALRHKGKDTPVLFAVFWFIIALLPFAGIYPLPAFYMSEHALYLPAFAFSLLIAWGLERFIKIPRLGACAWGTFALLIAFYSYATVRQNSVWLDPVRFYERNIRFCPECADNYLNLCREYTLSGEMQKALASCSMGISLDRENPVGYFNLANVFRASGKTDEAIALYQKAIEVAPGYARAHNNLVVFLYESGRRAEALLALQQALEVIPADPRLLYNAAVVYYHQRDYARSFEYYRRACEQGFRDADPEFDALMRTAPQGALQNND